MTHPARLFFLPGASGNTGFWRPVAERLRHAGERIHLGWPCFGGAPPEPGVRGFENLLQLVLDRLDRPSALIAPSMGGLLALQAALVRPDRISHLVLTLISGGLPMAEHGAKDWRETFQAAHPALPDWYATADVDRSGRLASLPIPTLRLWGDGWPHSCPRPLWWSFPAGPMIWRWRELPRSLR